MSTELQYISIDQLISAPCNPFHVEMDSEMEHLIDSIAETGVITPLIVRPAGKDRYEIVSGHRRKFACQYLGIETLPAVIRDLTKNQAAIALVDSNLQRENILPSERAFAYRLKMDALAAQGRRTDLTCGQVGHKSRDAVSNEDSGRQIQRYIRLTHLIPELLEMVDDRQIAFTPAVELSYLTEAEQQELAYEIGAQQCTPSLSQAQRLRQLSRNGELDLFDIGSILGEEKANQRERLRIPMDRIRKFFPKSYTPSQIEDEIVKLCEIQFRRRTERER